MLRWCVSCWQQSQQQSKQQSWIPSWSNNNWFCQFKLYGILFYSRTTMWFAGICKLDSPTLTRISETGNGRRFVYWGFHQCEQVWELEWSSWESLSLRKRYPRLCFMFSASMWRLRTQRCWFAVAVKLGAFIISWQLVLWTCSCKCPSWGRRHSGTSCCRHQNWMV